MLDRRVREGWPAVTRKRVPATAGAGLLREIGQEANDTAETVVTLKCSCWIDSDGQFHLGERCVEANCGECRVVQQLHPFGSKRLADLLFHLEG